MQLLGHRDRELVGRQVDRDGRLVVAANDAGPVVPDADDDLVPRVPRDAFDRDVFGDRGEDLLLQRAEHIALATMRPLMRQ